MVDFAEAILIVIIFQNNVFNKFDACKFIVLVDISFALKNNHFFNIRTGFA